MRITLGELRRIINEEVSRISGVQAELPLGWAGHSRPHRHAAPPDEPPEGFWLDPDGDGLTAFGDGEIAKWNPGKGVWDINKSKDDNRSYAGPMMGGPDRSMDRVVGGKDIGNAHRDNYRMR